VRLIARGAAGLRTPDSSKRGRRAAASSWWICRTGHAVRRLATIHRASRPGFLRPPKTVEAIPFCPSGDGRTPRLHCIGRVRLQLFSAERQLGYYCAIASRNLYFRGMPRVLTFPQSYAAVAATITETWATRRVGGLERTRGARLSFLTTGSFNASCGSSRRRELRTLSQPINPTLVRRWFTTGIWVGPYSLGVGDRNVTPLHEPRPGESFCQFQRLQDLRRRRTFFYKVAYGRDAGTREGGSQKGIHHTDAQRHRGRERIGRERGRQRRRAGAIWCEFETNRRDI